jgi:hypothetical protein
MSLSETQLATLRLHRRRGETLPYYCAIAAASLVTPNSSLNIATILPAGTLVNLNGQLYITRNAIQHNQWGEIDPLNWHPTYIGPKATGVTFADRAAVYWDETACNFTSVSTNKFVGYAVANRDLGSTTNGTASSLTTGTATNPAYEVTGGTSMDGLAGAYATGDTFMEVELVCDKSVTVSGNYGPGTALAGTGNVIGNAAAIGGGFVLVSGGNNAVGVKLTAGTAVKIKNTGTGGLFVYPPVGGTINAYGANNACNMATLTVAEFLPTAANSSIFYSDPTLTTA